MTEAELQRAVIELAHRFGYLVAHFRPAQVREGVWATPVGADGAGFPDLVIARKGRVVFAELKGEKGRLSAEQKVWQETLDTGWDDLAVGSYVWTPKEWASGEIETILR